MNIIGYTLDHGCSNSMCLLLCLRDHPLGSLSSGPSLVRAASCTSRRLHGSLCSLLQLLAPLLLMLISLFLFFLLMQCCDHLACSNTGIFPDVFSIQFCPHCLFVCLFSLGDHTFLLKQGGEMGGGAGLRCWSSTSQTTMRASPSSWISLLPWASTPLESLLSSVRNNRLPTHTPHHSYHEHEMMHLMQIAYVHDIFGIVVNV